MPEKEVVGVHVGQPVVQVVGPKRLIEGVEVGVCVGDHALLVVGGPGLPAGVVRLTGVEGQVVGVLVEHRLDKPVAVLRVGGVHGNLPPLACAVRLSHVGQGLVFAVSKHDKAGEIPPGPVGKDAEHLVPEIQIVLLRPAAGLPDLAPAVRPDAPVPADAVLGQNPLGGIPVPPCAAVAQVFSGVALIELVETLHHAAFLGRLLVAVLLQPVPAQGIERLHKGEAALILRVVNLVLQKPQLRVQQRGCLRTLLRAEDGGAGLRIAAPAAAPAEDRQHQQHCGQRDVGYPSQIQHPLSWKHWSCGSFSALL